MIYLPDVGYIRNTSLQLITNDIGKIDNYNEVWFQAILYLAEYIKSLEQYYQEFYLKNYWPKQKEVSEYYLMT